MVIIVLHLQVYWENQRMMHVKLRSAFHVSRGFLGSTAPAPLEHRKESLFLKRGSPSGTLPTASSSPALPSHRTEWACHCEYLLYMFPDGRTPSERTDHPHISSCWIKWSSQEPSPHFISQMKSDFRCLSPSRKLRLMVLNHGLTGIHKGLCKIIHA